MLQKLDAEHLNRLALAEALASMERATSTCGDPIAVSVATRCACLGYARLILVQLGAGANLLGLSTDQARELFAPVKRAKQSDHYTHPQDAARVMRYLAATDTVDGAWLGSFNQYTSSACSAQETAGFGDDTRPSSSK